LEAKIPISELIAGLVSLIDAILAATKDAPVEATDNQNTHIVEALHLVRARFDQMLAECHRGNCSAGDFDAVMNEIMKELRSRRS